MLFRSWQELHPAADRLPGMSKFDPMRVPRLLPNIFLMDVERDPLRFRFRLVGEAIVESGGPGRRGAYVDELPRTNRGAYLHDQLSDLVRDRQPQWYKGPPSLQHHQFVRQLEGVMLPMAENGVDVDSVLCLTVYDWADGHKT